MNCPAICGKDDVVGRVRYYPRPTWALIVAVKSVTHFNETITFSISPVNLKGTL